MRGFGSFEAAAGFCTVPSSAHGGEALDYRADIPQHNIHWEYSGRYATIGDFRF